MTAFNVAAGRDEEDAPASASVVIGDDGEPTLAGTLLAAGHVAFVPERLGKSIRDYLGSDCTGKTFAVTGVVIQTERGKVFVPAEMLRPASKDPIERSSS